MRFTKEKTIPDILRHITSLKTLRRPSVLQKNWKYKIPETPIAQMSNAIGAEPMRLKVLLRYL